ncbi:MAG TPA: ATP-binding protein [Candidatus Methanoperedens sp.]|nr:ATP-binding protein [Candidatus Methanoperedens sp.]
MADAGAVLPDALPAEAFFGRIAELRRLHREARSLLRGRGRSRAICARAGAGKTELLLQWHGRLFREGEILPLYVAVPETKDAALLADEIAAQIALQALAFARRDPSLLLRPLAPAAVAAGLRPAFGGAGALLVEELSACAAGAPAGSPAAPLLIPHRFALASGMRVAFMLDDAANLGERAGAAPLPARAVASTAAPLLLALEEESDVTHLLGSGAAALATAERLGPLAGEAVRQMARHLARVAGLELGDAAVAALEREAAGSPFYLTALVRALEESGGTGPADVARAAAASVCDGELGRYWFERLAGLLPERGVRATAVEILAYCLREGGDPPQISRLAALMLKDEPAVERALAGLGRAGVVRIDCARVVVDEDQVFRDAALALYRREFEQATPSAVAAACAAAKVRGAGAADRRRALERFRESLGALLLAWNGQRISRLLFDAPAYARRRAATATAAAAAAAGTEGFDGQEAEVLLPRVISVASGRVGAGGTPAGSEMDALAWGVRGEPAAGGEVDVAWIARRIPGGAGSAGQIAAFDRQVAALQAAGELPAAGVVRWAILDAPLDPEGEREAASLRLPTSLHEQLAELAAALGLPVPARPGPQGPQVVPEFELEMIIPRAADAELVAARALEQLAENLGVGSEETGRLKTALVEACINAFEHSGEREGRVRLWFAVAAGKLVIRVENRGRPLAALPAPAAAGEQPRRRGWGLTLIRQLIDEVRIEPREDGVSLVLVQDLGVRPHG